MKYLTVTLEAQLDGMSIDGLHIGHLAITPEEANYWEFASYEGCLYPYQLERWKDYDRCIVYKVVEWSNNKQKAQQ
jgi:hypothetical protein